MQLSLKWLKDYVKVNMTADELADILTQLGIAVDCLSEMGKEIDKVIVGEIEEVIPHPQADRLVLCRVKVALNAEPITIVTGAPNVQAGMKVPVALPGASLPNSVKIEKTAFRGIDSYGMLCSVQELQLDSSAFTAEELAGIMCLPQEAEIGTPIQKVLGLDDTILELDLTPNRSDCLSVINIAREVSAATGSQLTLPVIRDAGSGMLENMASVEIMSPDLCGRYVARIVQDVNIAPSPLWLKQRLEAAGMRAINNIVDITNFVMLEMGQPLHAFDYDKLTAGKIIVRNAHAEEQLVTLDGFARQLDSDMLVIADAAKPVGIAGVMGGMESEVTAETKTILLESAFFNAASIRRTSRKLGLRSEASSRFEKGVNRAGALDAINRAVDLIEQLGAGMAVPGKIDLYPDTKEQHKIKLRPERVNHILGTTLTGQEILVYLRRLNFTVTEQGNVLDVLVPDYRQDVTAEIDLIEEIARLHGYDLVPTTLPQGTMTGSKKTVDQFLEETIKEVLVGCGMTEIITYSFISTKSFDKIGLACDHPWRQVVKIKNPLSEEQSVMRTTLLPGLLEVASKNINRKQTSLSMFEYGRVFKPSADQSKLPDEEKMLAGLISGDLLKSWNTTSQSMDFYYLKGILEELFQVLNCTEKSFRPNKTSQTFHPGRTADIYVGHENLGIIGELHPTVLKKYGISQAAWAFEIRVAPLRHSFVQVKEIEPLPKYPAVERDMALLVPETVSASDLEEVISKAGGEYLHNIRLFDVYKGRQVPAGYKSMAYNMIYRAADRTLTDDEVSAVHQRIQAELQKKIGAQLR